VRRRCSLERVFISRSPISISHPRSRFQRQRRTLSHYERASEVGKRKWAPECPEVGPQDITARCRKCASYPLLFGTDICDSPMIAFRSAVGTVTAVAKLRRYATEARQRSLNEGWSGSKLGVVPRRQNRPARDSRFPVSFRPFRENRFGNRFQENGIQRQCFLGR
jgi:hypothetical protein